MSGLSATRGGLQTSIGANSLKKKPQLNKDTTSTVSGKSAMAQRVSANLRTANLSSGASQSMMSKTGSILSRPTSSSQVALSGSANSSAQVTSRNISANKKTGTNSPNGFVKSGFSAQQNFKFSAIRQSHRGAFLDGGNYSTKRAMQREMSKMAMLNAYYAQPQAPSKSTGEKLMEFSMGLGAMASAVGQIWDMFDSKSDVSAKSGTDTSNNSNNNTGNVNTNNSSSISSKGYNMLQNAENSAELSSGITLAKSEQTALEQKQGTLEKNIKDQSTVNEGLQSQYKQTLEPLKTANNNVKTKTKENETAQKALSDADKAVTKAQSGREKATANYESAKASYDSAKAAYYAAPDEQKSALKAKMDKAEAKMKKAQEKKVDAEKTLENAKAEQDKAQTAAGKADSALKQAQITQDKAIKANQQADKDYKAGLEKINAMKANLEKTNKDIDSYKEKIKTAEEKLVKMQEKEAKEADKLQQQATKNVSDGIENLEEGKKKGSDKVNKGNEKFNKANNEEQLRAISNATDSQRQVHCGIAFIATTYAGENIYAIDGKLVSEEVYNQRLNAAKQADGTAEPKKES